MKLRLLVIFVILLGGIALGVSAAHAGGTAPAHHATLSTFNWWPVLAIGLIVACVVLGMVAGNLVLSSTEFDSVAFAAALFVGILALTIVADYGGKFHRDTRAGRLSKASTWCFNHLQFTGKPDSSDLYDACVFGRSGGIKPTLDQKIHGVG